MKKKLLISDLKVSSFVTRDQTKVVGGESFPLCSGQGTCALYCSDTNGIHICKDTDNYTAYFC